MSWRDWFKDRLGAKPAVDEVQSGRPEDMGGSAAAAGPDRNSTTGATPNEGFVGRVGGDDPGYLETGAERRASSGSPSADTDDSAGTHGAAGAPSEATSDVVSHRRCPNCGHEGPHEKYADSGDVFRCASCGHAVTDLTAD